jgi:hypothetical protein
MGQIKRVAHPESKARHLTLVLGDRKLSNRYYSSALHGSGRDYMDTQPPNYALQRSWTHKLHGARTARKLRTRQPACAVTGRRAAAELRR